MRKEDILELIRKHFKEASVRDDGSCSEYTGTTEDFVKFGELMFSEGLSHGREQGYSEGYSSGYDASYYENSGY